MAIITIGNDEYQAAFEEETGALLRLANLDTGWEVQNRGNLARAFSAVVPLPERLLNVIEPRTSGAGQSSPGAEQVTVTADANGKSVSILWRNLISPHCGTLAITLRALVEVSEHGLSFTMAVENDSPYVVESIQYPYIGDLSVPAGSTTLSKVRTNYCSVKFEPLFPRFGNERGYWGVDHPIQMVPTPVSPLVLVQAEDEGLYIGCHDTQIAERCEFTFQLKPGYGKIGRAPDGDRIGEHEVSLEATVTHLPFVQPGERGALAPIVLRPYSGDWHKGVDTYKRWRASWMTKPPTPSWLAEPHSWQQLQMTSWGDALKYRYTDLVEIGRECAQNGVRAIQLVGWTLYGQDGRLPDHEIDPRLGTREELAQAIEEIQAMGVKVVLYEKYTCADISTDWYREELHRYASKDIFGNTHGHGGWQYHTPAHLAGVNTRPYAWMCMHSASWQDVALGEIDKSLELKPDGILLDESQWHGTRGFYCYDESHGHHVPAYNFGGDPIFERRLLELLSNRAESRGEALVLAGEGPWDLQYRHYNLSYFRTGAGHIPFTRYVDPYVPMMSWVVGYDDRESLNICLLYRYIASYEPLNFKGRLADFPLTLEYGNLVDALRTRYRAYLWDAEFRDSVGVTVTAEDATVKTPEDLAYTVFLRRDNGHRAIAVANHRDEEAVALRVSAEPALGELHIVSPEQPEPVASGERIVVPARSVIVLLEGV